MPAALSPLPTPAAAFAREVEAMRQQIVAALGPDDVRHLRRMERWGRLCTVVGYALAPWGPNPLAMGLISQGILTRWLLMHHIGHRGYDKVPGIPARYTSGTFAQGWRRFVDWFDWILPNAWRYEHNTLHHYHTGEATDPDLIERNVEGSWLTRGPRLLRYVGVALLAATWKVTYYAPNTFLAVENAARRRRGEPPIDAWWRVFNPATSVGRRFLGQCILPYALARFVALPALFLPLGGHAALWALINSVGAEICTNVHAFCVIAPNHAGDDLYRFDTPEKDKAEYYARQVLGSVNYRTGTDGLDYAQMWLNYQIEHHVWPDLPMLKYQQWQPRLRALCAEHGLPYVQEGVLRRVGKLLDILTGQAHMRRATTTAHAFDRARGASPAS